MLPVLFFARTHVLSCDTDRTELAVFRRHGDRLDLEDCSREFFPRPSENEETWLENTRTALRVLRQKLKAAGPVTLILPSHLVFTKTVTVPHAAAAKLVKVLQFEAEQNIPYALADVVWDGLTMRGTGPALEVLLMAAKLEVVESLCRAASDAGFEPRAVMPSSLGVLAAFRLVQAPNTGPALVLNVEACSATLLLVEPARFAVRAFRLEVDPGRRIHPGTNDSSLDTAKTTDAMRHESLATRLAQEIIRSVLHFRRQSGTEIPRTLYLTGHRVQGPALAEVLATKLHLHVERFDFSRLVRSTRHNREEEMVGLAQLAGAAVTQLWRNQTGPRLLPPRRRQAEWARQRRPWSVAAMLLALAVPVPVWIHFNRAATEAGKKAVAIERELAPLRDRELRNRTGLLRLEMVNQRLAVLGEVRGHRTSWIRLLNDLQEGLAGVGDVWLEKLRPISAAEPTSMRLAVSGRMLDKANPLSKVSPETFDRVKALWARLAESAFVAKIEGERFDNSQAGILRFDFTIVINPRHPL